MATTTHPPARPRDRQRKLPRRLRQLHWSTWKGVLVRSAKEFGKDNCTDWAASLTYYSVLAIFPSLIVVVALVGLVARGGDAVDTILGIAEDLGAGSVVASGGVRDAIDSVVNQQSSAGVLLSFGLLGALWSASGYVGGFTRAANAIYGVKEGRPFYKLRPLQLGVTLVTLVLLAASVVMLIVSGPVVDAVGDALNLGAAARTAWAIAKWPALVLIALLLLALLGWVAPNVRQPRFRWLTPGGLVTLLAAAVVSFGFGLYVANFASYDATYGSLGAVIAFLIWIYLINMAVLFGVEVNAEIQRGRAIQGGVEDAEKDPVLPERAPADDRSETSPSRGS
ncbi:YihY/virulence factor BrkB family protein [Polymorphospora sp. NPDC050346]|uniref:YihY/virulence factor BrkB family protein n=1 Tax=Polymorphospora sp. NPDC050346 TaxID=3155780 RepID=UPI00340CFBCA